MILHSYDYLMNENFHRIKSGKLYDEKFKPYTKKFINDIIKYFENREEYEKCQILNNYIINYFDHNINYTNEIYKRGNTTKFN